MLRVNHVDAHDCARNHGERQCDHPAWPVQNHIDLCGVPAGGKRGGVYPHRQTPFVGKEGAGAPTHGAASSGNWREGVRKTVRWRGPSPCAIRCGIDCAIFSRHSEVDSRGTLLRDAEAEGAEWMQTSACVGPSAAWCCDDRRGSDLSRVAWVGPFTLALLPRSGIRSFGGGRHQHGWSPRCDDRGADVVSSGHGLISRTALGSSCVHLCDIFNND